MAKKINVKHPKDMIYNAIVQFQEKEGMSPTIRELCQLTGVPSSGQMWIILLTLKADGLIDWKENKSRTLKITGDKR